MLTIKEASEFLGVSVPTMRRWETEVRITSSDQKQDLQRQIEIQFDDKDVAILDGQSKICNWLYNQLLQATIEDYKNGNNKKLLSGRNLKNYSTELR